MLTETGDRRVDAAADGRTAAAAMSAIPGNSAELCVFPSSGGQTGGQTSGLAAGGRAGGQDVGSAVGRGRLHDSKKHVFTEIINSFHGK